MTWINKGTDIKATLLYKGTKNGFEASMFHDKCDGKGPNVVFVKSKLGKRFGGYTSQWKKGGEYHEDSAAFLFSLSHLTKHE